MRRVLSLCKVNTPPSFPVEPHPPGCSGFWRDLDPLRSFGAEPCAASLLCQHCRGSRDSSYGPAKAGVGIACQSPILIRQGREQWECHPHSAHTPYHFPRPHSPLISPFARRMPRTTQPLPFADTSSWTHSTDDTQTSRTFLHCALHSDRGDHDYSPTSIVQLKSHFYLTCDTSLSPVASTGLRCDPHSISQSRLTVLSQHFSFLLSLEILTMSWGDPASAGFNQSHRIDISRYRTGLPCRYSLPVL